jgi:hypothetical protein
MDSPISICHINLLKNHSRLKIQNKRVDHKSFYCVCTNIFFGQKVAKRWKIISQCDMASVKSRGKINFFCLIQWVPSDWITTLHPNQNLKSPITITMLTIVYHHYTLPTWIFQHLCFLCPMYIANNGNARGGRIC